MNKNISLLILLATIGSIGILASVSLLPPTTAIPASCQENPMFPSSNTSITALNFTHTPSSSSEPTTDATYSKPIERPLTSNVSHTPSRSSEFTPDNTHTKPIEISINVTHDPIDSTRNEKAPPTTESLQSIIIQPKGTPVKGIYMTGWVAGVPSRREALVSLVDRTELNAIVLDIKDDRGELTGDDMGIDLANQIGAAFHKADLPKVVAEFNEHKIYPIARVVCFKDEKLASKRPDLAVKKANGQIWRDRHGLPWVDPYNHQVWAYILEIAKAAAQMGFKEIQFDYVRYVSDGNNREAIYPAQNSTKEDNIQAFLQYARQELASFNVNIAADVFGLTTSVTDDLNIGQKFEKISSSVDFICPMVYPSHYYPGSYGFKNPNAYPYDVVLNSMKGAIKKNRGAVIRPWLQDFTMGTPAYTAAHVVAQKKAVYAAGLKEWILWNASNKYHEDALIHSPTQSP